MKPTMLRIISAFFLLLLAALPAQAFTITPVKSPGGIEAWLVQDSTVPLISMNFSFDGGSAADPDEKLGLANFLSTMLDEGAGDMDSAAFQQAKEKLAFRLGFSADDDFFRGAFQTLSKNRDESFRLLALALNSPRFDAEPIERMRGQLELSLTQSMEDPDTIAALALFKSAMGDHPYARNSQGSAETLKAISADDLRKLHQRLFSREGLRISVVGDIDPATLGRLLDATFGKLPAKSGMPEIADFAQPSASATTVIDRDIPQSIIQFAMPGIKREDPDFIPAFVMNMMLGGGGFGSRLVEEVREKRGLTYSVYTELYPLRHGGLIVGGAATRNEKAAETIDIIKAEIARLAEQGPEAQELEDVKTFLTGSYALRFASGARTAGQLLGLQEQGLGIDYVEKRNGLVNAVTADDIRRVAARLLKGQPILFTVVGRPQGLKG